MFEKYVNLIRKRAHECSVKFNIDYEELESQGFLIYCECLKKYDVSKSGFSTYLYIQLNRLNDYAKTYKRQQGILIEDYEMQREKDAGKKLSITDTLPAKEISLTAVELLDDAKNELSDNAYLLLEWIIRREWEKKNKRTPTISMAVKFFHVEKEIIEKAWCELKNFWNLSGYALYS